MNNSFLDYYKCPQSCAALFRRRTGPAAKGYFSLGSDVTLYGLYSGKRAAAHPSRQLDNALEHVSCQDGFFELPFDPDEVAGNLPDLDTCWSAGTRV